MPRRLTEAFKRLRKNQSRAETLLEEFFDNPGGTPRTAGQPKTHEQELLRSVLVLTVGALDAYLSDLLIETIPRLAVETEAKGVFDRLAKARPGLILRSFFVGEEDVKRELAEAIEAEFAGDSMHGSGAVLKVSNWCVLGLGASDFNSDEYPSAFKTLNAWTDRRHRIVHRGELVRLRRDDVGEIIGLVSGIGRVLNDRVIALYG